jgi:pheromone shutdown protein TraB
LGAGLAYDPEVHEFKEVILEPRVTYISELMRQVAHVSKRVVAVIDEGMLPHIEDKWLKMPRNLRSLDSFFSVPKPELDQKTARAFTYDQNETWLEFIEKQVIMDVLFEPFIYKNFVRL